MRFRVAIGLLLAAACSGPPVVWEAGLGFEDDALLDSAGDPIASVGETIHGGGGYYGDRGHFENLVGEPIPERCLPMGNSDRFALIYEVETGPFEQGVALAGRRACPDTFTNTGASRRGVAPLDAPLQPRPAQPSSKRVASRQ